MTNHLLQSTLFAAVAGLLMLLLRKNHARARYWLWLAASLKFLLPFSVLVDLGSRLGWSTAHTVIRRVNIIIEETRVHGSPLMFNTGVPAQPAYTILPALLPTLWACGCVAVLFFWWLRWRRVTAVVRAALPLTEGREFEAVRRLQQEHIRLRSSSATLEPGIFGVFRPILLLPAGIADRLDDAQLEAIIAHEVCHVRRRDNLTAAIHMAIEAVFWFHPLVWWLGARLVDERERACDEEVLRLGSEPDAYAEGILKVCRFYLESPLVCVAGITGANLKRRIERIMTHRAAHKLGLARRLLLATVGVAAVAGPVAVGVINAPRIRLQSRTVVEKATFEVASVKPAQPGTRESRMLFLPGGGFTARNVSLRALIIDAHRIHSFQLLGGPNWIDSDAHDVDAKAGANLDGDSGFRWGGGHLSGQTVTISTLAEVLPNIMDRAVLDETGLKGTFDLKLEWTPERPKNEPLPDPNGPSIYTALQKQLGLKLESRKGPIEILVIARKKPSEN